MKKIFLTLSILIYSFHAYSVGSVESKMSDGEFESLLYTYYLNPQPELIANAIRYVNESGILNKKSARAPLIASFSCIFSKHDKQYRTQWERTIKSLNEPAKTIFQFAMQKSPEALFENSKASPTKNDMNWACYFATGEYKYLKSLIDVLQYVDERKNLQLFLTGASAQWSFSSNVIRHERVKKEIEKIAKGKDPKLVKIAQDILQKSPQSFREEMIAILKSQKEAGIW